MQEMVLDSVRPSQSTSSARAISAPLLVVVVHTVVVGVVVGQVCPLTSCAHYVEDGIDHLTHV